MGCPTEEHAEEHAPEDVCGEVLGKVDARVADRRGTEHHQQGEPPPADRRAGEYGECYGGGGMGRDGAEAAAHSLGGNMHRPVAGVASCGQRFGGEPPQDLQRVGCDVESFERGGEHRPPAGFETRQQTAQRPVVLEDAGHHVGQPYCDGHQKEEEERPPPAGPAPDEPEDQRIERQPHRDARQGEHDPVAERSAVEVEREEELFVESHGRCGVRTGSR